MQFFAVAIYVHPRIHMCRFAKQSLGTRFETGEADRPSGPDFADTSQVTHRYDWITIVGN